MTKFIPTKHRVRDKDHSRAIQEFVFENGGDGWTNDTNRVQHITEPFLFVYEDGRITFSADEHSFDDKNHTESPMPLLESQRHIKVGDRVRIAVKGWPFGQESGELSTYLNRGMAHRDGETHVVQGFSEEPGRIMLEGGEKWFWDPQWLIPLNDNDKGDDMNTITVTDDQREQLESILQALNRGDKVTIEPRKAEKPVEKWEPRGGEWQVNIDSLSDPLGRFRGPGLERTTMEAAERDAARLRRYARLLAWVDEHDPDFDPDRDEAWTVNISTRGEGSPVLFMNHDLLAVPMSREAAHKLAADLHSGIVEL